MAGVRGRFHTGGGVYGVAPDVVREFFAADDACDEGTGMNADANVPVWFIFFEFLFSLIAHECLNFKGGHDHVNGVILVRAGYPAGTHIAVADGFEFFYVELLGDSVEIREAQV